MHLQPRSEQDQCKPARWVGDIPFMGQIYETCQIYRFGATPTLSNRAETTSREVPRGRPAWPGTGWIPYMMLNSRRKGVQNQTEAVQMESGCSPVTVFCELAIIWSRSKWSRGLSWSRCVRRKSPQSRRKTRSWASLGFLSATTNTLVTTIIL